MAENNAKTKFTKVLLTAFSFPRLLQESLFLQSCKIMQKIFFDKCLLFGWLNHWICFLLPNLIWQDAISLYLLLRVNQGKWLLFAVWKWLLFEKLKGNYSLKRKKQPVRVTREDRCMLKEAATTRRSCLQMLFKIGVLENFAIFTGKHRCWSLF